MIGGVPSHRFFARNEGDDLRFRWHNIQGRFVDEPRHAVEEADQLVGFVIGRLAEIFADERYGLEQQWSKGKAASTEDLREFAPVSFVL